MRGDTVVEVISAAGIKYSIRYVGIGHPWHTIGPDGGRVATDAEYALAQALIAEDSRRDAALAVAAQHYLDATPWADEPREAGALPTVPQVQATRRELESFLAERGA